MGYEETALLTLYRRHSERCPVHKLKLTPAAKRKYMDCDCPLWIYGNTETTHVPRQSTGTNIIAVAEAQRQALLKNGQDQKVHGPRLDDCIERFSASRKEELGEKTAAAYRFQLESRSAAVSRPAGESDTHLISGSQDLVPSLAPAGSRLAELGTGYRVSRYRPRV